MSSEDRVQAQVALIAPLHEWSVPQSSLLIHYWAFSRRYFKFPPHFTWLVIGRSACQFSSSAAMEFVFVSGGLINPHRTVWVRQFFLNNKTCNYVKAERIDCLNEVLDHCELLLPRWRPHWSGTCFYTFFPGNSIFSRLTESIRQLLQNNSGYIYIRHLKPRLSLRGCVFTRRAMLLTGETSAANLIMTLCGVNALTRADICWRKSHLLSSVSSPWRW